MQEWERERDLHTISPKTVAPQHNLLPLQRGRRETKTVKDKNGRAV